MKALEHEAPWRQEGRAYSGVRFDRIGAWCDITRMGLGTMPPLYLDIALDGIALYDPSGYITGKLAYLRRQIREMGLQRIGKDHDWIWLWRDPPGTKWELEWRL